MWLRALRSVRQGRRSHRHNAPDARDRRDQRSDEGSKVLDNAIIGYCKLNEITPVRT
jgi:hypothetical protein